MNKRLINDFREQINAIPNNKIIFAPNSSGKTLFAESFINTADHSSVLINKENFNQLITNSMKSISNDKKLGGWDLTLSDSNRPFLKLDDIRCINGYISYMGISITEGIKVFLHEIEIKSGRSKCKLNNIDSDKSRKTKLQISSSQYEFVILAILIMSYKNTSKKVIIDDPVEMASFESEEKFVKFIGDVNMGSTFVLLTHRITLFTRLIGIHKKLIYKKISPSFIYFVDGFPFWISKLSASLISSPIRETMAKENKIFERIVREEINNILLAIDSTPSLEEWKKINIAIINSIGENKCSKEFCTINQKYIEDNLFEESLEKSLAAKVSLYTNLRCLIFNGGSGNLDDYIKNNSEKLLRKNHNVVEVAEVSRALNAMNHQSPWYLFNELCVHELLLKIERNFQSRIFKGALKKIADLYEYRIGESKKIFITNHLNEVIKILDKFLKKNKKTDGVEWTTQNPILGRKRSIWYLYSDDNLQLLDESGGSYLTFDEIYEIINELIR